jgi:ubiquinone/menaquinone biosynthesis C-methylase UbiE
VAKQGSDGGWRAELVGDLEGDVLEIGVGTGENLRFYRGATRLFAVEPDAGRADEARQAARSAAIPVTIEVASAERLPYEDQRFDHVVSSMVFCSVDQPGDALREIERVLRPNGVLHMMEHVLPGNPLLAVLFRAITPVWRRLAWNCHLDRPTVETLREHGWEVEVHKRWLVFVRISARQGR